MKIVCLTTIAVIAITFRFEVICSLYETSSIRLVWHAILNRVIYLRKVIFYALTLCRRISIANAIKETQNEEVIMQQKMLMQPPIPLPAVESITIACL